MESQQTLSLAKTNPIDKKLSDPVFERLVNETIDSVLSSLGSACRQAIYDFLETEYALKSNDIANHITEFSEILERIFGSAATLLEIEMMRRLCQKIPQFKYWPEDALTFQEYVNALSRFVCR